MTPGLIPNFIHTDITWQNIWNLDHSLREWCCLSFSPSHSLTHTRTHKILHCDVTQYALYTLHWVTLSHFTSAQWTRICKQGQQPHPNSESTRTRLLKQWPCGLINSRELQYPKDAVDHPEKTGTTRRVILAEKHHKCIQYSHCCAKILDMVFKYDSIVQYKRRSKLALQQTKSSKHAAKHKKNKLCSQSLIPALKSEV